jgi:hypothetical protein
VAGEGVLESVEQVVALFAEGVDVSPDSEEVLQTSQGPEASGDLGLGLDHANGSFRFVVRGGDREVF